MDCAGIGASNRPLRGNRCHGLPRAYFSAMSRFWSAGRPRRFRKHRKLKVLDVNARITERKSKRECKRSVQPFLTDRVFVNSFGLQPFMARFLPGILFFCITHRTVHFSGGKCSLWEGGTRGTSLLFAPRDLGYASEIFRNLWVFWV